MIVIRPISLSQEMTSGKTNASGTISALIDSQLIHCLFGSHTKWLAVAVAYDRDNTRPPWCSKTPMLPPVLARAESSCTSTEESSESWEIWMDGAQMSLICSNAPRCCTKLLRDTSCYTNKNSIWQESQSTEKIHKRPDLQPWWNQLQFDFFFFCKETHFIKNQLHRTHSDVTRNFMNHIRVQLF